MTLTQWNFEQLELGEGARWINVRLVVADLLADRVLSTRGDIPAPCTASVRSRLSSKDSRSRTARRSPRTA